MIIRPDDAILVTGAAGFIGASVIESLLDHGFRKVYCFVRPSSNTANLDAIIQRCGAIARVKVIRGNLLSSEDCCTAAKDVAVIYHLAVGTGDKSFPNAFMNSVVTTRNLLDACVRHGCLRRFVNISSLTVYTNRQKSRGRILDESCPIEERPELRGEAYCFAKVKQDELVIDYGRKYRIRYVILRPGVVYGPGKDAITGRVGLGTFGIFLHLGGSNRIPLTYVENCAEAIVLAGVMKGVDGEVFNIVDDDLPTSRRFLSLYKTKVRRFKSIYIPHLISYFMCYFWEKYSTWSEGQLPPVFNRRTWHAAWKKTRYTNEKLKSQLGWLPKVSSADGLNRYLECCRQNGA